MLSLLGTLGALGTHSETTRLSPILRVRLFLYERHSMLGTRLDDTRLLGCFGGVGYDQVSPCFAPPPPLNSARPIQAGYYD